MPPLTNCSSNCFIKAHEWTDHHVPHKSSRFVLFVSFSSSPSQRWWAMEQYLKNLPIRLHLRHLVSMIINLLRQQQHKYPFDSRRRNLSVVGRTRRCSVSSYDHRSSSWRHDRLPLIAITFRIYTIAVIIKHTRSYITRDYPPSPLDSSPRSPH